MRSAVWILLAAAFFAGFVLKNLRDARATVAREQDAMERLASLRGADPGPEREEAGYRFFWILGGDLPALLVARPLRAAAGRWFAATPEGPVFQYDAVLRRAPGGEPDVAVLRRHLALAAAERPAEAPGGWNASGP